MKKILFCFSVLLSINSINAQFSCNSTRLADVPGSGRYWATACSNNEYALVGGGIAEFNGSSLADFYLYNISTNEWTRVDDYPAGPHQGMMSFVINGRFFAGFGSPFIQWSNKLYELNLENGTWIPRAEAPFPAAYHQAYVANGKAYIFPAYENQTPSILEYDPDLNSWRIVMSYAAEDVQTYSIGFTIDNVIYHGMGYQNISSTSKRWYKFDPSTETLTQLNELNVGGAGRQSSAFKIGNTGYMYNVSPGRLMIRYDVLTDSWVQMCNFAEERFANSSAFGTDEYGYVVFGTYSGSSGTISSNQLWQFEPVDLSSNIDELEEFYQVYSGGDGLLHFSFSKPGHYHAKLFDLTGKLVSDEYIHADHFGFIRSITYAQKSGIYLLQLNDEHGKTVKTAKVYF